MSTPCLICRNTESNTSVILEELQLGLHELFTYQLCGSCGSMQLLDPPTDLTPYYPQEAYYSFTHGSNTIKSSNFLRRAKTKYLLYGKSRLLGSLLSIGYKVPDFTHWMMEAKVQLDDAILDVGCGNGMLVGKLHLMGFENITGIDPFLVREVIQPGVRLLKREIWDMQEKYALVMMHHVLEHIADPLKALQKAHAILEDDKMLLVRIPVMGNYGWQHYGKYWAGLDAPRHFFIPTEKGMRLLAEEAGFTVTKVEYDTVDYLIWCSEQYQQGISLYDQRSYMVNRKNSVFSPQQIAAYKQKVAQLNAERFGDTAAFYLRRNN